MWRHIKQVSVSSTAPLCRAVVLGYLSFNYEKLIELTLEAYG